MNPKLPPGAHWTVFHTPGPAWNPHVSFRDQKGVEEHVAYYGRLFKQGKIVYGGPFLDDSGGMQVFAPSVDAEEAKRIAENDPAVRRGLLKHGVKPWLLAFNALDKK